MVSNCGLVKPTRIKCNAGIDPTLCSLTYILVDTVAEKVVQLGQGTFLGKVDVKSAYRIVPVNPEDSMLLGVQWSGGTFLETWLPFGPTALADALEWIVKQQGIRFLYHYLNDYINTLGAPRSVKLIYPY